MDSINVVASAVETDGVEEISNNRQTGCRGQGDTGAHRQETDCSRLLAEWQMTANS